MRSSRAVRFLVVKNMYHTTLRLTPSLTRSVGSSNLLLSKEEVYNNQISIHNNDETKKSPLVFIFGWGYAKKKNLLKYNEVFEKKNFTSVIVTTSLVNSLFRTKTRGRIESENVNKVLHNLSEVDRDIIFYSFSNGGCAISYMLTKSLLNSGSPLLENLKGHIFDSCPIFPSKKTMAVTSKAFSNVIGIPLLNPLIKGVIWMAVTYVLRFNQDVKEFISLMTNSPVTSPQLFLFSKNDTLAPYEDIQTFLENRQERGINVHYKLWEDSPHVRHLKMYPDEYKKEVDQFIDLCLAK